MFCAMIVIAWPARVARSSDASAALIASRTSGGRSVEVRVIRLTRLSRKSGSIPSSIIEEKMRGASRRTPARSTPWRIERDPLGEVRVPAAAYYGVQTERAVENFPVSGLKAPAELVTATVHIKRAMALANASLGRLDRTLAQAIVQATDEILAGSLPDQFVVDVYQAGAGTSHNMNTNEVLANRSAEILGGTRGTYDRVHPNDHVNMGQSTNDVFPTATRLSLLILLPTLLDAAHALAGALDDKSREFAHV